MLGRVNVNTDFRDQTLRIEKTKLDGVIIISPKRHGDPRGFFAESWNKRDMAQQGLVVDWVQDNHSLSATVGTVRGLHFQSPPHAQDKLVRCGRGAMFDVAVDIRKGSPTFGDWIGIELTAQNGKQLLIPAGFLHGFVTRAADTEICYKCSDYYAPECDGTVRYDCPDIAIDWGLGDTPAVLSDKDTTARGLAEFDSPFTFEG